jgi:hypothetical protein
MRGQGLKSKGEGTAIEMTSHLRLRYELVRPSASASMMRFPAAMNEPKSIARDSSLSNEISAY